MGAAGVLIELDGTLRWDADIVPGAATGVFAVRAGNSGRTTDSLPSTNGCREASRGVIRCAGSHARQRVTKSMKVGSTDPKARSMLRVPGMRLRPLRSISCRGVPSSSKKMDVRLAALNTAGVGSPSTSIWYSSCSFSSRPTKGAKKKRREYLWFSERSGWEQLYPGRADGQCRARQQCSPDSTCQCPGRILSDNKMPGQHIS